MALILHLTTPAVQEVRPLKSGQPGIIAVRLVGGAALLSFLFAFGLYFPGENFLLIDPVSIAGAHERADDVVCCKSPFLQSQMRKSAAPRSQMTRREKR